MHWVKHPSSISRSIPDLSSIHPSSLCHPSVHPSDLTQYLRQLFNKLCLRGFRQRCIKWGGNLILHIPFVFNLKKRKKTKQQKWNLSSFNDETPRYVELSLPHSGALMLLWRVGSAASQASQSRETATPLSVPPAYIWTETNIRLNHEWSKTTENQW